MTPPAATRRAEPQAARPAPPRERILEAALLLFAEHGFSRVTMRTIGERVGLHNSSLFHHFRSKAEIAREVFERVLGELLPHVEPLARSDPPELEQLLACLRDVADQLIEHPEHGRFLMRTFLDPEVFLAAYVQAIDRDDARNPVVQLFSAVWGWLGRARAAGVVRPLQVHQAAHNLFGVLLFEPVYEQGRDAPHATVTSRARYRRHRLRELEAFVRGALAPLPDASPEADPGAGTRPASRARPRSESP